MNDAYAAGLFDGEGWVRIATWAKPGSVHVRYQVIAGIGMTYKPVIEQLKATYGGSIHLNRHDLRSPTYRCVYAWHIGSQVAASFFSRIVPFLIVKRAEVELAQALQASINEHRHKLGNQYRLSPQRDKIFAYRADLARQILSLKKQTFPLT